MYERIIWIAHGALHFVIDNAFVSEARSMVIRAGELEAMTFLAEVIVVQIR